MTKDGQILLNHATKYFLKPETRKYDPINYAIVRKYASLIQIHFLIKNQSIWKLQSG